LTIDHQFSADCAWSPDGKWVYFSSMREGTTALWRMLSSGGQPVRITMGTGPEVQPSVSRDGARLAYTTFSDNPQISLLDLPTGTEARLAGFRSAASPTIAPGRSAVVFSSNREGTFDLWLQPLVANRPEGRPRRLTDHPGTAATPKFSPDGRWIAYFRVQEGQRDVWVVPASGGPPSRITDDPGVDINPAWSPDGKHLAVSSDRGGQAGIWVVPVADGRPAGAPRRVTPVGNGQALFPAWSPDGRSIAYVRNEADGADAWTVAADASVPPRRASRGALAVVVRWDPSGRSLLVGGTWGEDHFEIRRVILEDGRVVPFETSVSFGKTGRQGDFDLSADGSLLAIVREEVRGDLWVLEAKPGFF
jgi:Tol biopolymer transport system component